MTKNISIVECDICGAQETCKEVEVQVPFGIVNPDYGEEEFYEHYTKTEYPDNWYKSAKYGDMCPNCVRSFDELFERLHMEVKAVNIARKDGLLNR